MYVSDEGIIIKLRVSAPRARNFIQLYLSYSRLRDVGFLGSSHSSLCWCVPGHWCIRLQLGGFEQLPS